MAFPFLQAWREGRGRDGRARQYVAVLMVEPGAFLVERLASVSDRDEDHARWELRYARRATGLLVAERDALDDSTSSEVARALAASRDADPNVATDRREIADRQFNERLSAYRTAWKEKTSAMNAGERLGAVLLRFAGAANPGADAVGFASEAMAGFASDCNAALRKAFGEATLPAELR